MTLKKYLAVNCITQRECALSLGISEGRVSQICKAEGSVRVSLDLAQSIWKWSKGEVDFLFPSEIVTEDREVTA